VDNVCRIREVVGNMVDLPVKLYRRLTPAEAVIFTSMIKDYNPMFVKDPTRPENAHALAHAVDWIAVPIVTGERSATFTNSKPFFLVTHSSTSALTLLTAVA
jgi:galactonate dehydratase